MTRGVRLGLVSLSFTLLLGAATAPAEAARVGRVTLPGPGYREVTPQGQMRIRPREAVADRLIIGLDPGVQVQQVSPLAAQGGGEMRRLLPLSALMIVDLPEGSDLEQAAERYRRMPGVRFAVPDTLVYPQLVPNDPLYERQYHLPLCRAEAAWDVTTGSTSTVIAIVDSGVDLNHPDLAAKIWRNPGETVNGRDDDGNGYVDDIHGWNFYGNDNNVQPVPMQGAGNSIVSHGTLAAGIAAAVTNEGYGTAGVDWNARIMPLKVFGRDGDGTVSAVVEAIDYAVRNGAHVINLSLGGVYSEAFTPPIERAWQAGVVVVASAGNASQALSDNPATWQSPVCNTGTNPLATNHVIGVAATDQFDRKAYYSNWDTSTPRHFIDVSAPGEAIYGPVFQDDSFPQFREYFGTNSGTSFSAPIVSGLAGLLIARFPGITPEGVIAAIRGGADNIDNVNPGYAGRLGTGRVNMARSLGVISPPLPARDLRAADTPGDQGGSIDLTWTRSGDDGSGAENVTGYTVRRRVGTGPSFTNLVQLPPGSESYQDQTTTDGVDYYYQIRTHAGTLFTDSEIAGPVQSRNDLPPPPVTTLTAHDRPGDSGSAIVLSWTYTPPDDFSEFRLYRDNFAFTSVAGRTPLAALRDASARTWTDTSTVDGVDYYYAITAVDVEGNEHKFVTAVGPVQSFPNQDIQFPAGVQFLATPAVPEDQHPRTLFGLSAGELRFARWATDAENYTEYTGDPLPQFLRLGLGRGFWVDLPRTVTVTPEGQSAPAGDYPVEVVPGWQMLGNPFFTTFDLASCTVTYQGETFDLPAAEGAGLIRAIAWIWDKDLRTYRLLSSDLSGNRLVPPWRGFWFRALQACTLNLARPLGAMQVAAASPRPAEAGEGWVLQLTAEGGGYRDLDNYVGVAAAPREIEAPPGLGRGVTLSLAPSGAGEELAARIRPAGADAWEERLTVTWAGVTGTVRLAWPQVNTLPGEWRFLLTDLATAQSVNLRAAPGYSFTVEQPAGQREFRLSVTRGGAGPVAVTSMSAQATGQGAEIVFVLSQAAHCEVRVMNIAGRTVRQVLGGSLRPAGQNVVLWDGRNQGGARVPAGRYLIELSARTEAGSTARLVRPVEFYR